MTEDKAVAMAKALGGNAWQSGGEIWLVILERGDGRLVVISDEVVCEYADQEAFGRSIASNSILIA